MVNRRPYRLCPAAALLILAISGAAAQHLENGIGGRVKNTGTIRFKSDTGQFRNAAPVNAITNNVIEFTGTDNAFTDLNRDANGGTALGVDAASRVPGLVRYKRDNGTQNVQSRFYADLEMADASSKNIVDGVYVGSTYNISRSGPRSYAGTFTYDGAVLQTITAENGLSGNTDRYDNLTILNGPKQVRSGDEIRMNRVFLSDASAPLLVKGLMFWGTNSTTAAPITIDSSGTLTTGSGVSLLGADVLVNNGEFVGTDNGDTIVVQPGVALAIGNAASAKLTLGAASHLYVLGTFTNAFPALTNTRFDPTSLVNYNAPIPQVMQATAIASPYGHLRTGRSPKTTNGDVAIASTLSVNDENVNMGPSTLHMTTGAASYTKSTEVIGAFHRDLRGGAPQVTYVYNNEQTRLTFEQLPQDLTLDVHPVTSPLSFDATSDIQRKVNVRYSGDWIALVRAGYKRSDIPGTWSADVSEDLLRFFDAQGPATTDVRKMLPQRGQLYSRQRVPDATSFGWVELGRLSSKDPSERRVDTGHDLLMRGSRDILKAIASGRWSNPATWDEGREPDPKDRVQISGFTVHVGYIRASDNYAVLEAHPDSMALAVTLGNTPNTSLLIGSDGAFNSFSLVRVNGVTFTQNRVAPSLVPFATRDLSAADIDGGLIVYPGATYLVPNLLVGVDATIFNGGTLQVGSN